MGKKHMIRKWEMALQDKWGRQAQEKKMGKEIRKKENVSYTKRKQVKTPNK